MPPRRRWDLTNAFRQGELDASSGPYAVINALRVCCGGDFLTDRQLQQALWLIYTYLDEADLLLSTLIEGCDQRVMGEMLAITAASVSGVRPFQLSLNQPFKTKGNKIDRRIYFTALALHLHEPQSSIIVHLQDARGPRWSVISAIKKQRVVLRDSTGVQGLRIADIDFGESKQRRRKVAVAVPSTFFVQVCTAGDP